MNKEIEEILNYMKQYVENKYEHDSEPMLNYKDLQIVLSYIEQLEKDKKELKDGWQQEIYDKNKALNDWLEAQRKINILENNRDKAIELLNELSNLYNDNYTVSDKAKDVIDILKGGSDE